MTKLTIKSGNEKKVFLTNGTSSTKYLYWKKLCLYLTQCTYGNLRWIMDLNMKVKINEELENIKKYICDSKVKE